MFHRGYLELVCDGVRLRKWGEGERSFVKLSKLMCVPVLFLKYMSRYFWDSAASIGQRPISANERSFICALIRTFHETQQVTGNSRTRADR